MSYALWKAWSNCPAVLPYNVKHNNYHYRVGKPYLLPAIYIYGLPQQIEGDRLPQSSRSGSNTVANPGQCHFIITTPLNGST